MIAFGCAIADEPTYESFAMAGISRVAEPDSIVLERREVTSIFAAYNEMIDELARLPDVEALVLQHQDTEILDLQFGAKLRRRLHEPDVAVIGVVGGRGIPGIAWWDAVQAFGSISTPRFGGVGAEMVVSAGAHDVDAVDGLILILSPLALRELRFDEGLCPGFHGYDADICLQARARGMRVIVDEIACAHHAQQNFTNRDAFVRAHVEFARKWEAWTAPRRAAIQASQ